MDLIGCFHMSGLFVRHGDGWPLALMEIRWRGP
jgi:hypothetical protein